MSTGEKGDKRADKRVPAVLRIRLKHKDLGTFVEKFAENVSHGGLFVSSKQPKPVGTELRFEILLANGEAAIKGEGRVAWTKEYDPEEPQRAHGMGIKFTKLHGKSREVLRRCLDFKTAHRKPSTEESGEAVHTGLFEVPEHARTDEDPDEVAQPAAPASPPRGDSGAAAARAGDGQGSADADLDALLAETGITEGTLVSVLAQLRDELGGVDALQGDLDALLIPEAQVPVTVDDASSALARLLGGDPVRRGARPALVHPAFNAPGNEEVTALMPLPSDLPERSEIDELHAPFFGDDEATSVRVREAREPSVERPAVAESGSAPLRVSTDEIGDELAQVLDAIEHDQARDTHVDTNLPQFLGSAAETELAPSPDAASYDDIPETAVRDPEATPSSEEPKLPGISEKRKSGFFKKLFGK